MIKPDYYPLERASEMLKHYSKDDLIRLGANNKLDVYVLTSGKSIIRRVKCFSSALQLEYEEIVGAGKALKVTADCLAAFEGGNIHTQLYTEGDFIFNSGWWERLREDILRNIDKLSKSDSPGYPYLRDDLAPMSETGTTYYLTSDTLAYVAYLVVDKATMELVNIKDCTLVILPDDLKRLKQPEPNLTESDRDKLLTHIGLLALIVAEKKGRDESKYQRGGKPVVDRIANDVQLITDAFTFPGKKATGKTEITKTITAGLKLLLQDDE